MGICLGRLLSRRNRLAPRPIRNHSIRFREELHGYQILGRKGQYRKTWRNLTHPEATSLYADALKTLAWLPDKSIMSTYATDSRN